MNDQVQIECNFDAFSFWRNEMKTETHKCSRATKQQLSLTTGWKWVGKVGGGERREACFCGPLRWLSLNQQLASKPQGHQKRKQNQRTEAVA